MLTTQQQTTTPILPSSQPKSAHFALGTSDRVYELVAVDISDHKTLHRPILALRRHLPLVEYLEHRLGTTDRAAHHASQLDIETRALVQATGMSEAKVRSLLASGARQQHPLRRPLVIRATLGERILVSVTNQLAAELLNMMLLDDDYGIQAQESLKHGERRTLLWHCRHAGIFPITDQAATSMAEHRCLLGALLDDYAIQAQDTAAPLKRGETRTLLWYCQHTGIYPITNQAATGMAQHRCLLGVLIVEPKTIAEATVP